MKTIEIDESIYDLLLRNVNSFGETPSDVLARLLNLAPSGNGRRAASPTNQVSQETKTPIPTSPQNPIMGFLNSPDFLVHGYAVEKFLSILSWLYKRDPEKFAQVLLLNGRSRQYFGRSGEVLEASGNSVMPKRIPDTPYWVITNSPTQLKKQMMSDVMRLLGYDPASSRAAVDAVR